MITGGPVITAADELGAAEARLRQGACPVGLSPASCGAEFDQRPAVAVRVLLRRDESTQYGLGAVAPPGLPARILRAT